MKKYLAFDVVLFDRRGVAGACRGAGAAEYSCARRYPARTGERFGGRETGGYARCAGRAGPDDRGASGGTCPSGRRFAVRGGPVQYGGADRREYAADDP